MRCSKCGEKIVSSGGCSCRHSVVTMTGYVYDIKELQDENKLLLEQISDFSDEVNKLKAELSQQKFNNKHNLSIDQKVSDEIERLKAENEKLRNLSRYTLKNFLYGDEKRAFLKELRLQKIELEGDNENR